MGFNSQVNAFKKSIIDLVNSSKLPPSVVALILENVTAQVKIVENTVIAQESEEKGDGENG